MSQPPSKLPLSTPVWTLDQEAQPEAACHIYPVQAALLNAGGCESLVRLLDGGPVSAGAGAGAWALMELCHRNPEGQAALLAAGGVDKVGHPPPLPSRSLSSLPRIIVTGTRFT